MAISAKSVGTWATVTATSQTVTLPTHAAGDMLIVRAGTKPYTATPSISTSGWTAVAAANTNGTNVSGNGTGSLVVRAWWKIAASAAETNPTIDWGATTDPSYAVAVCYQKGAGETWVDPVGDGGGDATARTSQTATIDTHISVTSGDMVDFFTVCSDNITMTVPTITQTGVTYDTVTEYPATAGTTTASNDLAADGGYRLASSGTSSAAAVVTNTFSAAEESAAWMTRLRVTTGTTHSADGSLAVSTSTSTGAISNRWTENAEGTDGVTVSSSNSSLSTFPSPASKLTFETTATVPEGSSYFRMTTTAASGIATKTVSRSDGEVSYFRFYFRTSAITSTTDFWRLFDDGATLPRLRLELTSSGTINIRDRDTLRATTTKALANDEWCRIEVKLDDSANTITFRMWWGADLHSSSTGATNYEEEANLTWTQNPYTDIRFGHVVAATASSDFDAMAYVTNGTDWIGPVGGTTHSADGSLAVAASNTADGTTVNEVAGSLAITSAGSAAATAVNDATGSLAVTATNTAAATVVNDVAGSLSAAVGSSAVAEVVNDIIGSQTYGQSFTATATVERFASASQAYSSSGTAASASVTDVGATPLAVSVGLSAAATVQNDVSGAVAINTSGTASATVVNDVAATNLAVSVVGSGTPQREANGAASQAHASAGTAAVSADRSAQGSLAVSLSNTAAATVVRAGTASLAISSTGSSAATVVNEVSGSLAAAHSGSASAEIDGQLAALLQVTSTGTANTSADRTATGSLAVGVSNTATASITNEAQANLPVSSSGTAVASIVNDVTGSLAVSSTGTAAASVTNDAQASLPVTVVSTAVATVERLGSASLAVASTGTAATSAIRSGSASLTIITVHDASPTKVLVTSGALPVAYVGTGATSADRSTDATLAVASSGAAVAVNPSSTPTIGQLWPRGGG